MAKPLIKSCDGRAPLESNSIKTHQEKIELNPSVEKLHHLARAWQRLGKVHRALIYYQKVLDIDPFHGPTHDCFAGLLTELSRQYWRQGKSSDALATLAQARLLRPTADLIRFRLAHAHQEIGDGSIQFPLTSSAGNPTDIALKSNPTGRIDLSSQGTMQGHRSGWAFVLRILKDLHNDQGVMFDGIIENNFAWRHNRQGRRSRQELDEQRLRGMDQWELTSEEQGITPYLRPWVGVIHNPPRIPEWFFLYRTAPQVIMEKTIWQKSLPWCVGFFAFSSYLADWLRKTTQKPVSALIHPTEIPEQLFSYERFVANPQKKIVQVGWWLRRLNAIYDLPIPADNPLGYVKVQLTALDFPHAELHFNHLLEIERRMEEIVPVREHIDNTVVFPYLKNDDYDHLLSENIAFGNLFDASANNAVIECMARGTPLLINPLPAVVEYLGPGYPFYYRTLKEAARKAMDVNLVREAHDYLMTCDNRPKLSGQFFLESFVQSEVYRLIEI